MYVMHAQFLAQTEQSPQNNGHRSSALSAFVKTLSWFENILNM